MDHELKQQLLSGIREKMETAMTDPGYYSTESVQLSNPYVQDIVFGRPGTF